jgi:hypothetical protein
MYRADRAIGEYLIRGRRRLVLTRIVRFGSGELKILCIQAVVERIRRRTTQEPIIVGLFVCTVLLQVGLGFLGAQGYAYRARNGFAQFLQTVEGLLELFVLKAVGKT